MNTNSQIKTTHLNHLTDQFGVWQHHEEGKILESEGYALDDSARALIVHLLYKQRKQAEVCLRYLENSEKDGKFVGFYWADKSVRLYPSSDDAFALAVWALAFCINYQFEADRAQKLLDKLDLKHFENINFIRTQSYILIAYSLIGKKESAKYFAQKIIANFNPQTCWFESKLTYANAIIPYALLHFYQLTNSTDENIREIIASSIMTLKKYMYIGKIPAPIGNRIWQQIDKPERDPFGQQPIDAAYMVLCLVKAFQLLKDPMYKSMAKDWIEWFYGNNIMKESLINQDFACADGIDEVYVSTHYGAESTIVYLWAAYKYNTIKYIT